MTMLLPFALVTPRRAAWSYGSISASGCHHREVPLGGPRTWLLWLAADSQARPEPSPAWPQASRPHAVTCSPFNSAMLLKLGVPSERAPGSPTFERQAQPAHPYSPIRYSPAIRVLLPPNISPTPTPVKPIPQDIPNHPLFPNRYPKWTLLTNSLKGSIMISIRHLFRTPARAREEPPCSNHA